MNPSSPLFDPKARQLRRARAQRSGAADFLHAEAAAIVSERLAEINKSFTNAAFVGWMPEIWQKEINFQTCVADSEVLELPTQTFDLVVSGLSLHHINDPVGQLVQMRRALKPDGLMIAAMFGGQTLEQLRVALAEAESQIEGGLSPRISPMGDIRDLGGLVQRAGLALPVADSMTLTATYETPLKLLHDLRAMAETNILTARRRVLKKATLARALEIYVENFATDDGRIPATFEIIFLTGWAPSVSQPKPLRRGSATNRLAEFLTPDEANK